MRRFAFRLRTLRLEQCGAAAVEFAIIAPMFFALLLSVVDVGRYMWTLNTIQYAIDEAVRAGAIQELSDAEIKDRVAEAVAPISSTDVAVTVASSAEALTVTANSTYRFFFPISAFVSGAPIDIRSEMPF
jgi:Flp pilus assembly protein TadG